MVVIDTEICYKSLIEAIEKASEIVKKGYESAKTVELKSATYDIVTEYDKNTEIFLIDHLSKQFPDHKFIGEETVHEKLTDQPTWIIDPIDGTNNFVHGDPHFAVSIGLAVEKEIVMGAICGPVMDQMFTAIRGKGAFLNGKRIYTSKVTDLHEALVGTEITLGANPKLTDIHVRRYKSCVTQTQGMRSIGCATLSLCLVALGVWDAYQLDFMYPWDVAAGSLIVTEAGGTVIDVDGGKFNCEDGRCIAAGTENLARNLINVFNI